MDSRVRQLLNICQADLKATLSESELSHIQWWTYVHEGATKVQDAQLLRPDATTVRADMFSAISSLAGKVFLPTVTKSSCLTLSTTSHSLLKCRCFSSQKVFQWSVGDSQGSTSATTARSLPLIIVCWYISDCRSRRAAG